MGSRENTLLYFSDPLTYPNNPLTYPNDIFTHLDDPLTYHNDPLTYPDNPLICPNDPLNCTNVSLRLLDQPLPYLDRVLRSPGDSGAQDFGSRPGLLRRYKLGKRLWLLNDCQRNRAPRPAGNVAADLQKFIERRRVQHRADLPLQIVRPLVRQ